MENKNEEKTVNDKLVDAVSVNDTQKTDDSVYDEHAIIVHDNVSFVHTDTVDNLSAKELTNIRKFLKELDTNNIEDELLGIVQIHIGDDMKKQVDYLYNELTQIFNRDGINVTNIVNITINLMQIVEKYPDLPGQQKKMLVLHVLKLFVTKHLEGKYKSEVLSFINLILPSMIDSIISIDKHEIFIQIKKKAKKCWTSCIGKCKCGQCC